MTDKIRFSLTAPRKIAILSGSVLMLGAFAAQAAPTFPTLIPPAQMAMTPYVQDDDSLGVDDGDFTECGEGCDEGGDPYDEEYPSEQKPEPEPTTSTEERSVAPSTGRTSVVVSRIEQIGGTCTNYTEGERIDCLSLEYSRIAQTLPSTGDYDDMRSAISIAAAELRAIAMANADPAAAPVRRTVNTPKGPRTSVRPITAVAPARVGAANAQAEAVLDRLTTKLLRSASSSASKRVHYERAVDAINSTKVLLRSA
jgi:hypothetical protein